MCQIELEQNIVDGARASLTYSYARGSETVGAAAGTAYLDEVLKGVGKDQNKKMLETFPVGPQGLSQIRLKLILTDYHFGPDPTRHQAVSITNLLI